MKLLKAVTEYNGNMDEIQSLLQDKNLRKELPDIRDPKHDTRNLLHVALLEDKLDVAEYLLRICDDEKLITALCTVDHKDIFEEDNEGGMYLARFCCFRLCATSLYAVTMVNQLAYKMHHSAGIALTEHI